MGELVGGLVGLVEVHGIESFLGGFQIIVFGFGMGVKKKDCKSYKRYTDLNHKS